MNPIAGLARTPTGERSLLLTLASASWSGPGFASLASGESMGGCSRAMQQPLTKVRQACTGEPALMVASREDARETMRHRFLRALRGAGCVGHSGERQDGAPCRRCCRFHGLAARREGAEVCHRAAVVAPKSNVDRALALREACPESWERMFGHMIFRMAGGEGRGKGSTKLRIESFKAQDICLRGRRKEPRIGQPMRGGRTRPC